MIDFSSNIPTFWILEGLLYYLEEKTVITLIRKIAEISGEGSQIFADAMQSSRWTGDPRPINGLFKDPISKYVKWGIDIKLVPQFFEPLGWKVSCSFADNYDQGRNVGQKAMIFIHGIKICNI